MSSKKQISIWKIMLVFILVQSAIAIFYNSSLNVGRHPDTDRFSMWFSSNDVTLIDNIQRSIQTEIFPDIYIRDNEITGADKYAYTYGSKRIYDLFYKLFREDSPLKFFGDDSAVLNFRMVRMLLFLNIFLVLGAIYLRNKLKFIPSKVQIAFEMFYDFFSGIARDSLGDKAPKFVSYYLTLFIFIWVCNLVGLIPIPGIMEPTRNLNVPLGLGIMAVLMIHYYSVRKKGVIEWGKEFLEPFFVMLPLNIVGEISKIVSVSFRLFGNIFGGGIIILVVSHLTTGVMVPVGLNMFFTLFGGTIQAFVFTMLCLTNLSLAISDE